MKWCTSFDTHNDKLCCLGLLSIYCFDFCSIWSLFYLHKVLMTYKEQPSCGYCFHWLSSLTSQEHSKLLVESPGWQVQKHKLKSWRLLPQSLKKQQQQQQQQQQQWVEAGSCHTDAVLRLRNCHKNNQFIAPSEHFVSSQVLLPSGSLTLTTYTYTPAANPATYFSKETQKMRTNVDKNLEIDSSPSLYFKPTASTCIGSDLIGWVGHMTEGPNPQRGSFTHSS